MYILLQDFNFKTKIGNVAYFDVERYYRVVNE